jgi:hypothetical protein
MNNERLSGTAADNEQKDENLFVCSIAASIAASLLLAVRAIFSLDIQLW